MTTRGRKDNQIKKGLLEEETNTTYLLKEDRITRRRKD